MAARKRLTDSRVRDLKPKPKRYTLWEGGGFGIRVTPRGVKSWVWLYRFEGRARRVTFGTYPLLSLRSARIELANAQDRLARGEDPGEALVEKHRIGGDCTWIQEGIYYDLDSHNALIRTLRDRRHQTEAARDEVMLLKARIVVLEAKLDLELQRTKNAEIRAEIERESCPTYLEQHIGWCSGIGVSVDTQGRIDASANMTWGWQF